MKEAILTTLLATATAIQAVPTNTVAATYNFNFNGAEQGDNSTATPSVIVGTPTDGEDKEIDDGAESAAANTSNNSVSATVGSLLSQDDSPHWRLTLGTQYIKTAVRKESNWLEEHRSGGTYFLSGTYFLNKYLGGTLFLSGINGLEVEGIPWRLRNDTIDIGILMGWSRIRSKSFELLSMFNNKDNRARIHIGARAGYKFDDTYGVNIDTRTWLIGKSASSMFSMGANVYARF